jgi:hypothetical protein
MKFRDDVSGEASQKPYVKLKDKESITGIFFGDIYEFYNHWNGSASVLCSGAGCEFCKTGDRAKFRFRLNFITKEGESYVPKVLEQGALFYSQIRELNKDFPLNQSIVKISRSGTGMDTSYTVLPVKDFLVKPEVAAKLKAVKLIDLAHTATESSAPATQTHDDIPF